MLNSSKYTFVAKKKEENHKYTNNIASAICRIEEAISSISYGKFKLEDSSAEIIINGSIIDELKRIHDRLEELEEETLYKPILKEK
jgi:hypothetical protein